MFSPRTGAWVQREAPLRKKNVAEAFIGIGHVRCRHTS